MIRTYIGIGSNQGDAAASVEAAIGRLAGVAKLVRRSKLYRTKAWGVADQPDFVNAVALLETQLPARALLLALKRIENELGRTTSYRWGPRTIDLDILTYGDERIDEPDLVVPHPYLAERAFVLVPLAELDPAYEPLRDALSEEQRGSVEGCVTS
jgi:2-amino-4-hydroxy-6-hydroxymethyldihydropteridine diphosphokinase